MKCRWIGVVVVLVTTACSSSTGHASASMHASPSTASTPTVTIVSPSPTPTGSTNDLPLSTVGFSCRLPVVTFTTGGDGISYQGGFITFPTATYAADPEGAINSVYPAGGFVTRQVPALHGQFDSTESPVFDAAAGRWIPSGAAETAPDGSTYAYATGAGGGASLVHVVNVRQGSEKTYTVSSAIASPGGARVEADDGTAVFFAVDVVEGFPHGVWRLDLGTGAVKQVAQVPNVMAVHMGYAWAGAVDPHDPTPPASAGPLRFDTIVQVNLSSGAQTKWFYSPGRSETLLGLAANGNPVLNIGDAPDYPASGGEVRLLDHASTGAEDTGQLVSGGGLSLAQPQGDGDRTWFGSDRGVYLYTPAGGLQKVFAFTPDPTTGKTMSPAGPCT